VNSQTFFKYGLLVSVLAFSALATGVSAQILVKPDTLGPNLPVVNGSNLYCAGYVQSSPVNTNNRLVGAVEEQDGFHYAQDDYVYLNMGASKGIQVGDMFAVIRPKGQVDTKWTHKGHLGMYVQEIGAVQIVRVKPEVSVARIKTSCDSFLLGDLVQPIEQRSSEMFRQRPSMDLFADPSGKARGQIFMARDGQELLARDQVVYVDLGRDDSAQIGDRLTIYRKLGKGNLSKLPENPESVSARDLGYHSLQYKGGKFSNQSARKSGDEASGRVVTTKKAKNGRPDLRKVVGEGIIVNVKEKTATVVITRTAQEIHTGDSVEIQ
jgi:hypothetical protein